MTFRIGAIFADTRPVMREHELHRCAQFEYFFIQFLAVQQHLTHRFLVHLRAGTSSGRGARRTCPDLAAPAQVKYDYRWSVSIFTYKDLTCKHTSAVPLHPYQMRSTAQI